MGSWSVDRNYCAFGMWGRGPKNEDLCADVHNFERPCMKSTCPLRARDLRPLVRELADALAILHAEQEGPPSLNAQREQAWKEVMARIPALLDRAKGEGEDDEGLGRL